MRKVLGCVYLLLMGAGLCGLARGGEYRLAGVQADRSPIGHSESTSGYKIRVCVAPMADQASQNTAQYRIQVGILDDHQPKHTAAQLWVLYD